MSIACRPSSFVPKLVWLAGFSYLSAWAVHLAVSTRALRGFFGDGALAFLIYLSHSYVFNKAGRFVHLFSVGYPRDGDLFINAFGLQLALWLGVRDPQALKYIYVFWQYALPGFLYIVLFFFLRRAGKASWFLFPLISWAVLSVAIDVNAINSTRWAVPIFWMHFFLVIFGGPKIRLTPLLSVIITGILMLAGLYEIVVLHAALCLAIGLIIWLREKNRVPFLYAFAAVPGAIRSTFTLLSNDYYVPNGFHNFVLLRLYDHHYFLFILMALAIILVMGLIKGAQRAVIPFLFLLVYPAAQILSEALPSVWDESNLRFDYIFASLLLMAWAGVLRLTGQKEIGFAREGALVALCAGSVLWTAQTEQTYDWQACFSRFEARKTSLTSLYPYRECVWDWTMPWTELLFADHGRVDSWTDLTFWQDFAFVKQGGESCLHTNNWTLTVPSVIETGTCLPLKTLLYDFTPLHDKVGDNALTPHSACVPLGEVDADWQSYLRRLDNDHLRRMFICPRVQGAPSLL